MIDLNNAPLNRQGVRNLGGKQRIRRAPIVAVCAHVWTEATDCDCWLERVVRYRRCSACHEVRS